MNRRQLISMVCMTAAWSSRLSAQAQPLPVVGMLNANSPTPFEAPLLSAFQAGLLGAGYIEGKTVSFDVRWARGNYDLLPELTAELLARGVNLIVVGSIPAAVAAKKATSTTPILFALGADPIASGLVVSLSRPGRNLTGVSILNVELVSKRVELLAELCPAARTIALLVNPSNANANRMIRDAQQAARGKARDVLVLKATDEAGITAAFDALVQNGAGPLVVGIDPFFFSQRDRLGELALRHAIPTSFGFPTPGALMSYGTKLTAVYRQLGVYGGAILNGVKPADLPIIQPTEFEFVINLRLAKSFGLTVPASILGRADEVLE